jgi:predicted acylesterase/phospholipase RssA
MTQQGPKVKAKTQADSEAAKDSKTGKKEKCIALVLGGGAPNLTMMSGAVAALDDEGVEFDLISTSGAGMLIGLLYASPKDMTRQEALRSSVNMGVHDAIYNQFPVNYKVFHKPGPMAVAYTKYWQAVAKHHKDWEKSVEDWWSSVLGTSVSGPWGEMYRSWTKNFAETPTTGFKDEADAKRFYEDMAGLMLAAFCPSDLSLSSQGLCQWAPFVEEVVDFEKVKDYPGEFYLSSYCIEDQQMVMFPKEQISIDHFQAALSFPLIYSPYKMDGKTYIEGAAIDTLNFEALEDYRKQRHSELGQFKEHLALHQQKAILKTLPPAMLRGLDPDSLDEDHIEAEMAKVRKPLTSIVVCDILGLSELIGEPRSLYDAWVKSIIIPLTAVANDDLKIFEDRHLDKLGDPPGSTELLKIKFRADMPPDHWPNVLDWSYSNLTTLFDVGYRAGKRFFAENKENLVD